MRGRVRHIKAKSFGATASWDSRFVSGLSNGSAVSSLIDLSGNGYDASQTTGSKQPTYQQSVFGGQPSIRFDGSDDQLIHTASNTSSCVIIAAYQTRSSQDFYRGIVALGPADEGGTMLLSVVNAGNWGTFTTSQQQANTLVSTSTPSILTLKDDASNGGTFFLNGSNDGTWSGNSSGQNDKHIGGVSGQSANIDVGSIWALSYVSDSVRKLIEKSIGFSFKIACS